MKTKIPIKPHLKKFVLYMMNTCEPMVLDEKRLLGRVIIKVLIEKRTHKFTKVLENYTERIEVVLSREMVKRSPMLHRLVYMNAELERLFTEALIVWVLASKRSGRTAKEACLLFLEELHIRDEEYTYDAAYKAWQRYQEKALKIAD